MTARKSSRQRALILQELRSRRDHPSADMIYSSVREKAANISLGTVYRNLSLLADDGKILRLSAAGADRFDGDTSPHYHFICRKCGCCADVAKVPDSISAEIARGVENVVNARVQNTEIIVYGLCPGCIEGSENHENQ